MDATKRYRVETEKIQKAMAEDFAEKLKRKTSVAKKYQSGSQRVRQHFGSHLAGSSQGESPLSHSGPLSIRDEEVLDSSWLAAYSHRELNHLHVKESAHRRASE
jgi:argonaute-like protein implicated in RNA metabolism and viral defense